ncbi:TlpA disulfide reductase family protein [Pilimelia columellifera]|uniref:Thioredoxin domain-containing protein n=1 Tax=Pilimelia columellifera subsp. columellifera TaxID=706583 RepID=A0ABP6AMA7_9ACTN
MTGQARRLGSAALAAGVALALVAGCSGDATPPATAAAFASCAGLTAPDRDPGIRDGLPALSFECLTGGAVVRLDQLAGPAVVNLWATWCAPCRAELPAFQRLAERDASPVRVIGVLTGDEPSRAAEFGQATGVRFPQLVDRDHQLGRALGHSVLPLTIFVDAGGRVAHVYRGPPLTDRALSDLTAQRLGGVA